MPVASQPVSATVQVPKRASAWSRAPSRFSARATSARTVSTASGPGPAAATSAARPARRPAHDEHATGVTVGPGIVTVSLPE